MGDAYFEEATTCQEVVSKTLRWPSRAALRTRVPLLASAREVIVFWWWDRRISRGRAASRSRTEIVEPEAETIVLLLPDGEGSGRTVSIGAAWAKVITARSGEARESQRRTVWS